MRATRQEVDEISLKIEALKNRIKIIQSECPHSKTTPIMYMWRIGSMEPILVCDECDSTVEGITERQRAELWDKWRRRK